ncbi:MAG: FGGY-family carbohydrate kinase [bacterium]|jgi:xylulokinase
MSLIGLDIGTTGCKAIAFDHQGKILAQASQEYDILTPQPGWAEQDAELVFERALEILKTVIARVKDDDVPTAMAFSVQGEAVVPVDAAGRALRHMMLGMDTRTTKENQWLTEHFGAENLFSRTGMPLHTINTLPKLLWLREHEKDLFQRADQYLLYEDFLIRRLTGKAVISHCLASRTQMYDLAKQRWAEDILEKCGIETKRLAELAPADGGVDKLLPEWKSELGLKHDLLLISGGHDQACAALGSGVIEAGKAMVSTGTAEVVEVAMDSPQVNEALRKGNISVYRHTVPGLYLAMTLNHSGGLLLRWFRDTFCEPQMVQGRELKQDTYELILKDAPSGPTTLFVLPHFAGSGTPWLDTRSKGAILGMTFSTNRATLAKAILEGLTFELRVNLDLLRHSGVPIEEMHAVGGGAKSLLWLQLKADICQVPLRVPQVTEAACLGAAILAGVGSGVYPDYPTAVAQTVQMNTRIEPQSANMQEYDIRYRKYERIYPAVRELV